MSDGATGRAGGRRAAAIAVLAVLSLVGAACGPPSLFDEDRPAPDPAGEPAASSNSVWLTFDDAPSAEEQRADAGGVAEDARTEDAEGDDGPQDDETAGRVDELARCDEVIGDPASGDFLCIMNGVP